MPEDMHRVVVMGRLGAPYGVAGWQHIQSYTHPMENILQFSEWVIAQKGEWISFTLAEWRIHGQGIVARLEGVESREVAALLTNHQIGVSREKLSPLPEGEFYWADLEGLKVETQAGECLGQVHYVYANAGTDILVIQRLDGEEQHIPFVLNETIVKVDVSLGTIIVDWDFNP